MKIAFDPAKRERGIDFADALEVFAGATLVIEDRRANCGERRFQTIGFLAGRMVMVVWTPRHGGRHVISMRKCNEREQKAYGQRFAEG